MQNFNKQRKPSSRRIYIHSQCLWLEVSEADYQEYVRFYDTYRQRQQDNGLCCCPCDKRWVCDADCPICEYHNADVIASLDSPTDEEINSLTLLDTIEDKTTPIADLITDRIVMEQLFNRLADLMPEAINIGELRLQGLSDKLIAKTIGIPCTTFLSHIKKTKKLLEQEYPDFF